MKEIINLTIGMIIIFIINSVWYKFMSMVGETVNFSKYLKQFFEFIKSLFSKHNHKIKY